MDYTFNYKLVCYDRQVMTDLETIIISKRSANLRDYKVHGNELGCYQIASQTIVFSSGVDNLKEFSVSLPDIDGQAAGSTLPISLLDSSNAQQEYQGKAPFNGSDQVVTFWRHQNLGQINIGEEEVCQIDLHRHQIRLLNDKSYDEQLNFEVVTGPALITLLALRNVFCLHASAVATDVGNIIFIAESGVGKSTLSSHQGKHWQQLADDISPIRMIDQVYCLQAFPQLKLANGVPVQSFPEKVGIDLIVRLSGQQSEEVQFRNIPRREAVLEIVRHTVASKMFDFDQLKAQMQFAQKLSQAVPMIEARYPRDLSRVDELRKLIIEQGLKVV